MNFWRRLTGKDAPRDVRPQRLDYQNEALAFERVGDFESALTSYRLAFRDHPRDARLLVNMAIVLTKLGQIDESIRHYRRALEIDPGLAGAHYGVAFLLLKRGHPQDAVKHLQAFLARSPRGADAEQWVRHAEETLQQISGAAAES